MTAALRTAPLSARIGMAVVLLYLLAALFAPWLAPFGETEIVGAQYLPWDAKHPLGTDGIGRDMLSRLIFGARNTLAIAVAATVLAFVVGAGLGMLAALRQGFIDQLLSRAVDVLIAIPSLIFKMMLLTIFGTSVATLVAIIALIDATRIFRVARAISMNIAVNEYVEAAYLRGDGILRLVGREILPNAAAPLVAEFGLRFCFVFLSISALSFLGIGLQPPMADWGSMVRENASLVTFGDITPLLPAFAIAFLTIGTNLVVDWMLHRSSGLKD
jgi:peptide/nickel transport system permease protein